MDICLSAPNEHWLAPCWAGAWMQSLTVLFTCQPTPQPRACFAFMSIYLVKLTHMWHIIPACSTGYSPSHAAPVLVRFSLPWGPATHPPTPHPSAEEPFGKDLPPHEYEWGGETLGRPRESDDSAGKQQSIYGDVWLLSPVTDMIKWLNLNGRVPTGVCSVRCIWIMYS